MDFEELGRRCELARQAAEDFGQEKVDACIQKAQEKALQLCFQDDCEWAHEAGFWYQDYPSGTPYRKVRYQLFGHVELEMHFRVSDC